MTQKQTVINRINEVGYVDNFWAIQNYILRLGAIIYALKKEGWRFEDRRFGIGKDKKNYFYRVTVNDKQLANVKQFLEEWPSKPAKLAGPGGLF